MAPSRGSQGQPPSSPFPVSPAGDLLTLFAAAQPFGKRAPHTPTESGPKRWPPGEQMKGLAGGREQASEQASEQQASRKPASKAASKLAPNSTDLCPTSGRLLLSGRSQSWQPARPLINGLRLLVGAPLRRLVRRQSRAKSSSPATVWPRRMCLSLANCTPAAVSLSRRPSSNTGWPSGANIQIFPLYKKAFVAAGLQCGRMGAALSCGLCSRAQLRGRPICRSQWAQTEEINFHILAE